jgi:hypothetical protein
MTDVKYPWRSQDDVEEIEEDVEFLFNLGGHQLAFSKKASRKIGGDADQLACIIADRAKLLGRKSGYVRCNGQGFYYELIRTELTWTEDPTAPYDKFNFTREVSVCTSKETGCSKLKVAKPTKRKRKK